MTTNDSDARRRLTFAQAEGLHPLPRQLSKEEMPPRLRARLWQLFEPVINSYHQSSNFGQPYLNAIGRETFIEYFVNVLSLFPDDVPRDFADAKAFVSDVFRNGNYVTVFNFVQFMIRHYDHSNHYINKVGLVLEQELCAYRVVGGDTLVAVSSSEEAVTIQDALSVSKAHGAKGAHAHIRNAINSLNQNAFSDSVRESISAVESISKVLANEPKAELSKALNKLEKSTDIHGGMKAAFNSLYGYTSDEKGVRHALLFKDKADVDETDALFMIGACSAFISYLIRRANDAGISVNSPV